MQYRIRVSCDDHSQFDVGGVEADTPAEAFTKGKEKFKEVATKEGWGRGGERVLYVIAEYEYKTGNLRPVD